MDTPNEFSILREMLTLIKSGESGIRSVMQHESELAEGGKYGADENKELLRRLKIQNKKLLSQVALLKAVAKLTKQEKLRVEGENRKLIKHDQSLSAALGSCAMCWGENPECAECSGNGSPGWRPVNKRMFNLYLLPLLEKMYGLGKIQNEHK